MQAEYRLQHTLHQQEALPVIATSHQQVKDTLSILTSLTSMCRLGVQILLSLALFA